MKSIIITITFITALFTTNSQETFQTVFSTPQYVEIKATLNFDKCNNKAYIPIDLPANAKGWIYSITEIQKKDMDTADNSLLDQVEQLSVNHDASSISDFIRPEKSRKTFNLYIMNGKKEATSFYNCGCYNYLEKYIGTKPKSGYIENKGKGAYFIGIENAHDLKNLRLKVEAVAVL